MALQEELSAEVDRILLSPYPASLKRLADVLDQLPVPAVRQWVRRNSCRVSNIAAALLEALPRWPYTLRILQHFSQALAFRRALLEKDPGLLDALCRSATTDDGPDGVTSSAICILLLSDSLADNIVPASAQSVFLVVAQRVVQDRTLPNIRLLYLILKGACQTFVDVLPSQVRTDLERSLLEVLDVNDIYLATTSLACLVYICSPPRAMPVELEPAEETWKGEEIEWRHPKARELFCKRALKTLHYTVGRVIKSLRPGSTGSEEDPVHGIRVAMTIVRAINPKVRQEWLKTSSPTQQKLWEMMTAESIPCELHLEAFYFFSLMIGSSKPSSYLAKSFRHMLLNILHIELDEPETQVALSGSLRKFAVHCDDDTAEKLFIQLFGIVQQPQPYDRLLAGVLLVGKLTEGACSSGHLQSALLRALSNETVQSLLQEFVQLSLDPSTYSSNPSPRGLCSAKLSDIRVELSLVIMKLCFSCAFPLAHRNAEFLSDFGISLLEKQTQLSSYRAKCSHSHASLSKQRQLSIFQEGDTPMEPQPSRDWKQSLKSSLQVHVEQQQELIFRAMGKICQDLEERCDRAEAPLQAEQRRANELASHASKLEADAMDRRLLIDSLEAERAQNEGELNNLEIQIRSLESQLEDRSTSLRNVEKRLHESAVASTNTLRGVRAKHEAQLTELQLSIAQKEEIISNESEDLRSLTTELTSCKGGLAQARLDVSRLTSERSDVLEQNHRLNIELSNSRAVVVEKEAKIGEVKTWHSNSIKQLEAAHLEIKQLSSQVGSLIASYDGMQESWTRKLDSMEAEHHHSIQKISEKATSDISTLEAQLHETKEGQQQTTKELARSLQQLEIKDSKIKSLKNEVHQQSDQLQQKETEVGELAGFRARVLASMGLNAEMLLTGAQQPTNRRKHSRGPGAAAIQHQVVNTEDVGGSGNSGSESKSSTGGTTPKRQRSLNTSKANSVRRRGVDYSVSNPGLLSTPRTRTALASIGNPNTQTPLRGGSSKKVSFLDKQDDDTPKHDFNNLSFDASDLFTSTPMIIPHARSNRQPDEETTVCS